MSNNHIIFSNLERTYLIAEIGINHNGDISFAKKMADYASVFGWDCIKLQKRNPELSTPEHQKHIIRDTPWGKMTYLDYKKKVEFEKKAYDEIFSYCRSKIDLTASVWDIDSAKFMCVYKNLPFIKIPSAHLVNDDLLHYICKKRVPILLSTGMSTLEEVDHAVDILKKFTDNFALLHTNSTYPAAIDELELNVIPFYKERYGCVVGYSGHEFGLVTTVIAVCLGARIIERHVTLRRTMWGTDQMASVEPQGMLKLISQIRATEQAMGNGIKKVHDSELPVRKKLRGC